MDRAQAFGAWRCGFDSCQAHHSAHLPIVKVPISGIIKSNMENTYTGKERRRFPRLRVSITVVYQIDKPSYVNILVPNEGIEAVALDLSEGGIAILADAYIPPTTPLNLEFMLYTSNNQNSFRLYRDLRVKGEVCDIVETENSKYRIGIGFTQISPEDRAEIINFVKQGISFQKPEAFPGESS
jgi:c-di-GMP-binding flagellar brake protein YcgR